MLAATHNSTQSGLFQRAQNRIERYAEAKWRTGTALRNSYIGIDAYNTAVDAYR